MSPEPDAVQLVQRNMGRARAGWWAVVVSLLCHAAIMGVAGLVGARLEPPAGERPDTGLGPSSGDTFEIDALIDGERGAGSDAERSSSSGASPAPAPRTPAPEPAAPAPAPAPEFPPEPTPAAPEPAPAAAPESPPAPAGPNPDTTAPDSRPAVPEPTPELASPPEPAPKPAPPPEPVPAEPEPSPYDGASADPSPEPSPEPAPPPRASGGAEEEGDRAGADGENEGEGRRYGAEGDRRGVRRIGAAFTHAVPHAVSADPVWTELSVGVVGTMELTIRVGRDGELAGHTGHEKAPDPLKALARRTMAALGAGRFMLSNAGPAGEEVLRIRVTLEQREPLEDEDVKLWRELPTPEEPGHAYFTLGSGRHFDAEITIVASKTAPAAEPEGEDDEAGDERGD